MKLLIVRHAETNPDGNGFNQNGGIIGALSENGKYQAERIAQHLSSYKVSYIYTSDIVRAVATSYVISDSMPDVTVMLTKDLRIKDPDESADRFRQRIASFLDGLKQKFDKQTIIIVSHSDAIQVLFELLNHKTKTIPGLSSVSEFDIAPNSDPVSVKINDTGHLV